MSWLDWMGVVGDVAGVAGLVLTAFALHYAKSARQAAREARASVRKANASETMLKIGETATSFQACVENDQLHEAVVRARDLMSELSRYKLRYGTFLDVQGKERMDAAREQVSVISRSLSSRGRPATPEQKNRLLRICHDEIASVLNEESARILAVIEKEQENA